MAITASGDWVRQHEIPIKSAAGIFCHVGEVITKVLTYQNGGSTNSSNILIGQQLPQVSCCGNDEMNHKKKNVN